MVIRALCDDCQAPGDVLCSGWLLCVSVRAGVHLIEIDALPTLPGTGGIQVRPVGELISRRGHL